MRNTTYLVVTISILIVAIVGGVLSYYIFAILKIQLDQTTALSIINGVATSALALVAALNMIESRKVRSEMVRPHLSLEPTFFEYNKNGQIVGFNCLNLANGGVVARDVEIDVSMTGKTTLLYSSSIGTSERVQIWAGESDDLSGNIIISLKYKNIFNRPLKEILYLNMDLIKNSERKFAGLSKN